MATFSDPLGELSLQEPIFHRPAFARTREDFAALRAEDYWEVGASGNIYDRAFVLEHLARNPPVDAAAVGWEATGFALRALADDTFLVTYRLAQGPRHTRRATLWRRAARGWQILYHQGTLIAEPRA